MVPSMNERWRNTGEEAVIGRAGLVLAVVAGMAVAGPAAARSLAALVEDVDAPGAAGTGSEFQ